MTSKLHITNIVFLNKLLIIFLSFLVGNSPSLIELVGSIAHSFLNLLNICIGCIFHSNSHFIKNGNLFYNRSIFFDSLNLGSLFINLTTHSIKQILFTLNDVCKIIILLCKIVFNTSHFAWDCNKNLIKIFVKIRQTNLSIIVRKIIDISLSFVNHSLSNLFRSNTITRLNNLVRIIKKALNNFSN